jgi:outer membrane biosynthesis protein TonB
MTTAEFIIGHSAEDAEERKQEARKVFWALLAALFIHLLIGYGLAVYGGLLYAPFSVTDEEDKPVELSFVDLATPAPTKNTMYVPNDESKQTEAPKDKTFESNANSIAASQNAAIGSMPLPSQDGSERTKLDFDSNRAALANEGAQPHPSVAPQQSAEPQPSAQPTPITKSDELAMLTKPTPRPSAASTPQPPKSAYQPYKERTRLAGSITNRGTSAVNAVGTPLGRYQKTMFDAIGSHWYAYIDQKSDLVSLGTTRVTFFVDPRGHVKNLKILSNDSNEAFANVCLQAILDSKLPPIPEEVAEALPPEGLESEISFTTFSNR